jgi:hypothetical protein
MESDTRGQTTDGETMKPIVRRGRCRWGVATVLCLCACALSGCAIGPPTLERDRLDYQTAISESWKRQILLNLVRVRYADAPVFLEVASIISQYSTAAQLNAGATLNNPPWSHQEQLNSTAAYADKPTVTYMPMTGEKFARSLFTPLPPSTLFSLVQAGWPVDMVLRLTCSSANGIHNQSRGPATARPADPQFEELLAVLRRIQLEGTIATRVEKKGAVETAFMVIGQEVSQQTQAAMARVREMLKLDPDAKEFRLVYGTVSSGKTELALQTRSMSQLLIELAGCIDVPPEHVAGGKTYPTSEENRAIAFIRIHSGASKPSNAFVEVQYRGSWFWVDDGDFASKRMLSLMMMFFSLVETGNAAGAPIVTVTAG